MSNYLSVAVNPKTGEYEEVAMLDDFYGHYKYAVLFKDGSLYPDEDISKRNTAKWEDFDLVAAYKERPEGLALIAGHLGCNEDEFIAEVSKYIEENYVRKAQT